RCSIINALSGQQTVPAKPPKSVRLVIGPRASLPYIRPECGENRIIKASAHSETNEHPGEQINRPCMRQTNKREACGIEQRTCQQNWSSAADIDNAANLRRD